MSFFLHLQPNGSKKPSLEVDRLKPRHLKRKSDTSSGDDDSQSKDAKVARSEFKTEYKKLRNLVPALQERSDITKVSLQSSTSTLSIRIVEILS